MTSLADLRLKGAVLFLFVELPRIHLFVLSSDCLYTPHLIDVLHALGHPRVRQLLFTIAFDR